MASLFAILSAPVRMHDGAFAIVVAAAAGIEVKAFATAKAARRHYRILLAGLQMAAEPAFELVVVDGESDYATLRTRIDREYARRADPCVGWAKSPPEEGTTRTSAAGDFAHADETRGHCARTRSADESIENAQCPPYRST